HIRTDQQKIITAIRDGQAPDAALVGLAGTRSRHNTYMSVALVWTMIDSHTTVFNGWLGLPGWIWLLVAIAVAWLCTVWLYKKAPTVKGSQPTRAARPSSPAARRRCRAPSPPACHRPSPPRPRQRPRCAGGSRRAPGNAAAGRA